MSGDAAGERVLMSSDRQRERVYVAIADHWSYIGVGWLLGLESAAASIEDALALADSSLGVKTSLNFDAHAYERLAVEYPELVAKLQNALAERKVDVIGGSFSQPLGSTISGESNVRQLVLGREIIRRTLAYDVPVFLEQEEFSHPQLPQLLVGAGYRYASLAQSDTWGRQGVPVHEVPVIDWEGKDGSSILSTTSNCLVLHTYKYDWPPLLASEGFRELAADSAPLITKWDEFGWAVDADPQFPKLEANLATLAQTCAVEFVTIGEYLDTATYSAKRLRLRGDDWHRLLAWGIGGDQIRIADRRIEMSLRAAETFAAMAHLVGAKIQTGELDTAWRSLLTAQSHDVALCEYTVHVRGVTPVRKRLENFYNASWGTIGFEAIRAAEAKSDEVSQKALRFIASQVAPLPVANIQKQLVVFNPSAVDRSHVVTTGMLTGLPTSEGIRIVDPRGEPVLSQVGPRRGQTSDSRVTAEISFAAKDIPAFGYSTFGLIYEQEPTSADPVSDLVITEDPPQLENSFLLVELDTRGGGIARLLDKRSGKEYVNGARFPFPAFHGKRNPDFPVTSFGVFEDTTSFAAKGSKDAFDSGPIGEHYYDSTHCDARVDWIERGPLRATVKLTSAMPLIYVETFITLAADTPWVNVSVRLAADVPPATGIERPAGHPMPVNFPIDGYWLSLAPAFDIVSVIRDGPFSVEETWKSTFHSLTMVDLIGDDCALLLAHSGTQYFQVEGGVVSNLVMREWESYFSNRFGWPPLAEYEYALVPHPIDATNTDRVHMVETLSREFRCVAVEQSEGALPARHGFASFSGARADVSCLRVVDDGSLELRIVEYDGIGGAAKVDLPPSIAGATEVDLAGRSPQDLEASDGTVTIDLRPFGVHTLRAVIGRGLDDPK